MTVCTANVVASVFTSTEVIALFFARVARQTRVFDRPLKAVMLGAVDTLIDVVGAVTLLDELGVERLVCSPLPSGRGMVQSAHGVLPLPAPAIMSSGQST